MSPHFLYNAHLSPTVMTTHRTCPCIHVAAAQPTTFYTKCQRSGYSFLIDTGACRSFVPIPSRKFQLQPYRGPVISTANGQPLKIDGCVNIDFIIQGQKYKWEFIVANVAVPILGADFLASQNLAVDMGNKRLISLHHTSLPPIESPIFTSMSSVLSQSQKDTNIS